MFKFLKTGRKNQGQAGSLTAEPPSSQSSAPALDSSPQPAFAAKRKFDLPPSDLDRLDNGFAPTVPGDFR